MAVNDIVIGSELGPEFEIGTTVPNFITVRVDGVTVLRNPTTGELSTPLTSLGFDNTTGILTFINETGNPMTADLSAFFTDVFVTGGNYNAANMTLTLTDNDAGTPDVVIDLSSLLGVSADAGNILTDGADGKPFLDCDKIRTDCTTVCQSVFGTDLFRAFEL